jgi:hypothetical protein
MTMGVDGVVGLDAQLRNLVEGRTYLFEHVRKGPFVGVFKGVKDTKEGDPQDVMFLAIDIYTEDGSGQERLANSFIRDELGRKMRPTYSPKFIRPSLLISITSPDEANKKRLGDKFYAARAEAEAAADKHGHDVLYPSLSLPTSQALNRLKQPQPSSINNKLVGGAIGAAAATAATAAYLLGVI